MQFFELLTSPDKKSVKNAGLCIAAIGAIEIQQNLWPDFIDLVTNNATA
jgi:hypothetical protein